MSDQQTATDLGYTTKGQPQEPEPSRDANARPVTWEEQVTLTIVIPHYDGRVSVDDGAERVLAALRQEGPLPNGTGVRGSIEVRARSVKDIERYAKQNAKRRAARGY